ncbi:MAG: hypothetical protein LBE76_06970, partial [Nitrososphaerota archaeon]|nr:hypothetical protein [Nitrososphaerota archaeon]
MHDFYDTLAFDAQLTIDSGYYDNNNDVDCFAPASCLHLSLKRAILECRKNSVIAEIKRASPVFGVIRDSNKEDLLEIAKAMERGGAVAISVLTEPKHFKGSIDTLSMVRKVVRRPLLMKDIILSPAQIRAAVNFGADAVLLIKTLYDRGYGEISLDSMIEHVHLNG